MCTTDPSLPKDVNELEAAVRKFIFDNRVPGPPPASAAGATASPQPSVEVPPVDYVAGQAQPQVLPGQAQTQVPTQGEIIAPSAVPAVPAATAAGAAAPVVTQAPIPAGGSVSPAPPPASIAAPGPPVPGPHYDQPPK